MTPGQLGQKNGQFENGDRVYLNMLVSDLRISKAVRRISLKEPRTSRASLIGCQTRKLFYNFFVKMTPGQLRKC